jgi:hypothetical protein
VAGAVAVVVKAVVADQGAAAVHGVVAAREGIAKEGRRSRPSFWLQNLAVLTDAGNPLTRLRNACNSKLNLSMT